MRTGPEFALTDEPRTGTAESQASAQSAGPDTPVDPSDRPPQTTAEASTRVSEEIARRAGRGDDAAPLGDPNAPQGSGPETDMSQPHNRPAPIGKIRMSEFESGPDHEQ